MVSLVTYLICLSQALLVLELVASKFMDVRKGCMHPFF